MKKIFCIILSVIILISVCFICSYIYTLNYYTADYDCLKDILTGYSKEMTTITEYKTDYYKLLNSSDFEQLSAFDATTVIMTSNNIKALTFASNKVLSSKKYDAMFFLGSVFLKDSVPYLKVVYIENGRMAFALYKIMNEDFVAQIDMSDFEDKNYASDMIYDCFATLFLAAKKYIIVWCTISVTIITAVLILKKQKKQTTNTNKTGK